VGRSGLLHRNDQGSANVQSGQDHNTDQGHTMAKSQTEILAERINNFFYNLDVLMKWALIAFAAWVAILLIFLIPEGISYLTEDHKSPAEEMRTYNRYICVEHPTPAYASVCERGDWNEDGTVDAKDAEFAP
jgi:hypothetical protein